MIKALFWKEWNEQRWKLVYGCTILMGFTAVGLRSRVTYDETILDLSYVIGALLLPLFVGMGLVAAERSAGNLATLLALPVRPGKVFLAKLIVGGVACIGPVVGSTLLALLMVSGRELSARQIAQLGAGASVLALEVLAGVVSFGIRQSTEARAGLIGMGVLAGWGFAMLLLPAVFGSAGWRLLATMLPVSAIGMPADQHLLMPLILTGCLLAWAAYRFGNLSRTER